MIRQGSCCLGLQENKKEACGLKARAWLDDAWSFWETNAKHNVSSLVSFPPFGIVCLCLHENIYV
jgi:hypothetical protein